MARGDLLVPRVLVFGVLGVVALGFSSHHSAVGSSDATSLVADAPVVVAAPVAPPCTPDLENFDACTSSGTASLVHSLLFLDPEEQGSSELICNYTGTAQLELNGGMWRVLYTGQNWHVQEGLAFACGGEATSGPIIVAGTYTLDPLEFTLDDNFVCEGDQFDFDGQTMSGVINAFCNPLPRDVYTFSVTLGPADDEVPDDEALTDDTATDDTATAACIPTVSGLSPAQPGEVISPSASYTTPTGEATAVIQDRWFLNGVNTTSIVWDGGPVTAELQYTCLDNSAGTRTFTIPAFGSPTIAEGAPGSGDDGGGGPDAGVVGAIFAGVLIIGGVAWTAIRRGSGRPTPPPATGEATSAGAGLTPPRPPPPPPPRPPGLTPADRARLESLRSEMQGEVNAEKAAYQKIRRDRAVLLRLLKKNLLKVFMKQGLEAQKFIRIDPVEVLKAMGEEVTPDSLKIVDRIFEKHDSSRDSQIVVEMKRQLDAMQAEMQQHIRNVRHLQQEIQKIDTALAGG